MHTKSGSFVGPETPHRSFWLLLIPLAGKDYVGVRRRLDFAPGVHMQTFLVTILADALGQSVLEGPKRFELLLQTPLGAVLAEPHKAIIFIDDTM